MTILIVLYVLFTVAAIAGAVRTRRLILASRKAGHRPNTLHAWSEKPLNSWKYEPYAAMAILIHTLSVLVLGFLALGAASNRGLNNPLLTHNATMIAMAWFTQCGCISIVGYQLGSLLIALPLITLRGQPVDVAITENGMGFGKNLMPWRWFSHFSIDSDEGILRLYSAFSPDLPSLTLKLPDAIPLAALDDTIHNFLPISPSVVSRARYRTKLMLIPMMLLVCFTLVALGWLASHLATELSLFMIALLTTLLVFVGGLGLNLFAFGVLTTRNNSSMKLPTA